MILHLIVESQFTDYVINQFSTPEMHSEVVIIHSENYIKHKFQKEKVRIIRPYSSEFEDLLQALPGYSAVVLHGLFEPWCGTILQSVPANVKVVWSFWGGDLFGRKDVFDDYLAPRTNFVSKFHGLIDGLRGKKNSMGYELPKDLFRRVDFFITDMQKEWEFAKLYCNNPSMKYHWYNYYSIEDTLRDLKDCEICGENIIIGNSATIECNYFDVIGRVGKLSKKENDVIIPLSYGTPWVKNLVLKYGKIHFGKRFKPLVSFVPLAEYNKVLLSCSTMIQPHYRSQAQGNIITGLWLGMRVYLSERSCAYSYFKEIGAVIFSIEKDLRRGNQEAFSKLPQIDVKRNRQVLQQWYGKDAMYQKNLDLVELIDHY